MSGVVSWRRIEAMELGLGEGTVIALNFLFRTDVTLRKWISTKTAHKVAIEDSSEQVRFGVQ